MQSQKQTGSDISRELYIQVDVLLDTSIAGDEPLYALVEYKLASQIINCMARRQAAVACDRV